MKIFTGKVVSTRMQKTAKVEVESFSAHPMYLKRIKRSKTYLVHDELGTKEGDRVRFVASKPFSKLKKWKIIEVVGKKVEKKGKK